VKTRHALLRWYQRHRSTLGAITKTALVLVALFAFKAAAAHAGTDSTFDDLNTLMSDWSKGSLGKALAMVALLLGIGVAAARQSFAALFAGIGVAAGATVGPNVISTVITAVF